MSIKLKLQAISEWVTNLAAVAKGAIEFSVQSGILQDSLKDLCDQTGVAGAVFKLGAMALPDMEADAEQRIAARLARTYLKTVDAELKKRPTLIKPETWREYRKAQLETVATKTLSAQFTWLQVFGSRGRKASRSWPIVAELADFARAWVWEAALIDHGEKREIQQEADDIRGIVHDALAKAVDELLTDPVVVRALDEEAPLATRTALELLAERLATFRTEHLFGEVPQDKLFIKPAVKMLDCSKRQVDWNWWNAKPEPNGDDLVFAKVTESYGSSRVIVIEGEMGVGKSCLMRELTSRLASQFLSDRKQPVVQAQWRDIYNESDLTEGIESQLAAQYRLPFHDLDKHENLVILIDGFDEMRSHEAGFVASCFDRLLKLAKLRNSTVIVAMRSTVVSETMRIRWKEEGVLLVHVSEFSDEDVDRWVGNWRDFRAVTEPTGDTLRTVCARSRELVRNPLLLFMLARYVYPVASKKNTPLTRAEVFRVFVDETIAGKARQSGEKFPIHVADEYRLLLQEIAWIASWPENGGKCPESEVRQRFREIISDDFRFADVRTAFVLHFFQPGQVSNEFEFHPEGFRHYLLAEWCVRTQLEALVYEDEPGHRFARMRADAMNALAQLALREEERELVNEIYEKFPALAREPDTGGHHLRAFGLKLSSEGAISIATRLYDRVRRQAESPSDHPWKADTKVGLPKGQVVPPSLEHARLLANYWDQVMLAAIGMYRGLGETPTAGPLFQARSRALARLLTLWETVYGPRSDPMYDLSRLDLSGVDLAGARLWDTAFRGSILREVSFDQAYLPSADFTGAKVDLQELEAAYAPWAVVPGGILQPWGAELVREGRAGFEDVRRRRLTRLSGAGLIRELHLADAYRATQPGGRDN